LATVDPNTLSGAALTAFRTAETHTIVTTYLGLAAILFIVAVAVWLHRNRLREQHDTSGTMFHAFGLLAQPRFALGAMCIFLYVGAEVAIGSLLVNYLMQPSTLGLGAQEAGKHVPFYWGGALVGRFIGSGLLRVFAPGKVLACVATGAIALILISANTAGTVSGWTLLAVGLMNSIMFPTIFSLASEGLGKRAAEGAGVIGVAIVGGAVIPPLTGALADRGGLHFALVLPAMCYAVILAYGVYARRPLGSPLAAAAVSH
jgi:FHS family L-fucose permease-like MFS transporter